jgi:two-component system, chemotaxis family, chemotaxis protein CheY
MKTLIVDDDKMCGYVAQSIMKKYGIVDVATCGREGIALFEGAYVDNPYTVVILDIMMPEIDGQQVLQKIREFEYRNSVEKSSRVKVIMLSGIEDKRTILNSFQGGCEAYLTKPLVAKVLEETVKEVLGASSLPQIQHP